MVLYINCNVHANWKILFLSVAIFYRHYLRNFTPCSIYCLQFNKRGELNSATDFSSQTSRENNNINNTNILLASFLFNSCFISLFSFCLSELMGTWAGTIWHIKYENISITVDSRSQYEIKQQDTTSQALAKLYACACVATWQVSYCAYVLLLFFFFWISENIAFLIEWELPPDRRLSFMHIFLCLRSLSIALYFRFPILSLIPLYLFHSLE